MHWKKQPISYRVAPNFSNWQKHRIKQAYAEVFAELIMPMGALVTVEVNFPALIKAVDFIYPKAEKMAQKLRHSLVGFPLVTALLCVSQKEFFATNWLPFFELCLQKLKDRSSRMIAMGCIRQLVWVYTYRCTDSPSATFKKTDALVKIFFHRIKTSISTRYFHGIFCSNAILYWRKTH